MKTLSIALSIVYMVSLLASTNPVHAETLREARKDVGEAKKTLIQERKDLRLDIREKVASRVASVKAFFKSRVDVGSGKLNSINGTTLTVEKDGKVYTVLTGAFDKCTSKFRKRFWGTSSISEFTVGDLLNVSGRFQDEAKTTIEACVIRDISIQKRFGVFIGEVQSVQSTGWIMTTVGEKRANQTVTVSSTTKYTDRKEQSITQSDIKVGQRVRVKGLWNRTNNTVTEVTQVKNYSLPLKPTVSVTSAPTVTPTLTPTVTVSP